MENDQSLAYLDPFIFCGLCFNKMSLKEDSFFCPSGCLSNVAGRGLESILWAEMGKMLKYSDYRATAERLLQEKLSNPQLRLLFKDLKGFLEFLPTEEKARFANALVEKIDILSIDSFKIIFRV